jgi:orotate phosphoribosyltransferase
LRSPGETLAVFVEKSSDNANKHFLFTRGYDKYITNKNILVVEDVLSTGGSVRQVVELIRQHGGNIIGVSALCNRGNVQPHDIGDVPLHALIDIDLQTYAAEESPLCSAGVPINIELGKGQAFLDSKDMPGQEPTNLEWQDLFGAWSDLPDAMLDDLDRIRHSSPPTPPLELP